jgi:hypothetical protein
VERLVVIWCPDLLEEGERGEEARRFAAVVARAGELCPWVHTVRLGVCALPARGPARFFGGEEAVLSRLVAAVDEDATAGVADGLFAAMLAARAGLIVPPAGTPDFLAPLSVATLARPDLAVTLQRLDHQPEPVRRAAHGQRHGPLRGGRGRLPRRGPGRDRGTGRPARQGY